MLEFLEELDNVKIIKRNNNSYEEKLYPGLKRFYIQYKFLMLSTYYDPKDFLGIVDEPYFEIYARGDTARFLMNEKEEMKEFLINEFKIHDKEIEEHPENFL